MAVRVPVRERERRLQHDDNPNCDSNAWLHNRFVTVNQPCRAPTCFPELIDDAL